MSGTFGENFPYSNFHDLNMDWIIKIAKDFLDQYTHIQQIISDGEASIEALTDEKLLELQDKATELENLLQEWYNTHSQDIATQLATALADLNDWYTTHQNFLDQYLQTAITTFNNSATQKGQEVIASIPPDYTTLSNDVAINAQQLYHTTGNEILYSHSIKVKDMQLYGVNSLEGYLYADVHRACTTLLPLHAGQVIRNISNILYRFSVYKYDRFGNYISGDVGWYDELYPITSDGLYRLVFRGSTGEEDLTSVVDSLSDNIIIQDLAPNIFTEMNYLEDECYFFNRDNLVQGRFYYVIPEEGTSNRIRPRYIIPVKKGTSLGIFPNGTEMNINIYSYNDVVNTIEQYQWIATIENITIQHDGYMAINIKKPNDEDFTPMDFMGYIYISNRSKKTIVVDASGKGDTTSFSAAVLRAFLNPNTTIYVKPGLYDVAAELEFIFGSGYLEHMLDTYFLAQGLPWGNGTKIIGSRGSVIRFDASNIQNAHIHHYFSILNAKYVDNGFTMKNSIDGCMLQATKCKYCIHMDQGAIASYNTFEIKKQHTYHK